MANTGIHSPPVIVVEPKTYSGGATTQSHQTSLKLDSRVDLNDPSVRHDYNFRPILALEFSPNGSK